MLFATKVPYLTYQVSQNQDLTYFPDLILLSAGFTASLSVFNFSIQAHIFKPIFVDMFPSK